MVGVGSGAAVGVVLANSPPVSDAELSRLHALAFGEPAIERHWSRQLMGHSLGWVCAFEGPELVGFVNLAWDGDLHAFLLDTVVRPDRQRRGIGTALVRTARTLAQEAGCRCVHVDTSAELLDFYLATGDMEPAAAAVASFGTLAGSTPGVVRVGDTVRRPWGPWVPTTRALLAHLEAEGFPAPRHRGVDEDDREVLTWVRGAPSWLEHARHWGSPERLAEAGRLVRRLHDALDRFEVPDGAVWRGGWDRPEDGHGPICHHDLAPWNVVIGPTGELSVIDWDGAGPGDRMAELAYAACGFVPVKGDAKCFELGWIRPPDRVSRLEAFRRGYGLGDADRAELADAIVTSVRSGAAFGEQMHAEGREPWASIWAEDMGAADRADVSLAEHVASEWRAK
ncbi:MAG TPA: GNAT family N-acetyltransferase [Acidimicrobiales bacterium]|nr:GNAT family N-acetyltransferase [Acidimicrobiales bacterium]